MADEEKLMMLEQRWGLPKGSLPNMETARAFHQTKQPNNSAQENSIIQAQPAPQQVKNILPISQNIVNSTSKPSDSAKMLKDIIGGSVNAGKAFLNEIAHNNVPFASPEARKSMGLPDNIFEEQKGISATGGHLAADAFELLGGIGGAKLASKLIRPQQFAKEILEGINPAYAAAKEISSSLYNNAFKVAGDAVSGFKNLNFKSLGKIENTDVVNFIDKFKKHPNLKNSHELQSQIGAELRKIGKPKDVSSREEVRMYKKAHQDVKNYIENILSKNTEAKSFYQEATHHYKTRKLPYEILSEKLRKIPEEELNSNTFKQLYRHLHKKSPTEYSELGLQKPIIPMELKKMYSKLGKKQAAKNIVSMIAKPAPWAFGGFEIGSHLKDILSPSGVI